MKLFGTPPLRLYWWNQKANFGDGISPLLVAHLSGRKVVWAEPEEARMISAGSLMRAARMGTHARKRGEGIPVIWGTGTIRPIKADFVDFADIRILRGPISAALLGVPMDRFGDPALLLPDIVPPASVAKTGKIGVVLHHSKMEDPAFTDPLLANDDVLLIDPRAEDPLSVVRQIASCAQVISSSLHGVIVADAFGIPNTWIDPEGIHEMPRLKFLDYAGSIRRQLGVPIPLAQVAQAVRALDLPPLAHADGIEASRDALRETFPAEVAA